MDVKLSNDLVHHSASQGISFDQNLLEFLVDDQRAKKGYMTEAKMVEYLESGPPLHVAVLRNNNEMLENVLSMIESDDVQFDCLGFAPVHYCALFKRMDLLTMISEGVMISKDGKRISVASLGVLKTKDKKGRTPLHLAASIRGREEVLKFLIKNGADVNEVDFDQCPALHHALDNKILENAETLVSLGANVNFESTEEQKLDRIVAATKISLLSIFARWGNDEAVQFLMDHGVSRDNIRWPILHCVTHHQWSVLDILIDDYTDQEKYDLLHTPSNSFPSTIMSQVDQLPGFSSVDALEYLAGERLTRPPKLNSDTF